MRPSDPSLLIAASIILDSLQNHLKHKSLKEQAAGLWTEWLAWAILSVIYWTIPVIQGWAPCTGVNSGGTIEEKHQTANHELWVTNALSALLVGSAFLSQREPGRYDWALPTISTILLVFTCGRGVFCSEQRESWRLPLTKSDKPRTTLLVPTLVSTTVSLMSTVIIRHYTGPNVSRIDALAGCLVSLQCFAYIALAFVNVRISRQSQSGTWLQKQLLRRVSVSSFVLWTLVLAWSHTRQLNFQPTFVVMGMIRAFHYFVLFTLCLQYSQFTVVSAAGMPSVVIGVSLSIRATSFNAGLAGTLVTLGSLLHCVYFLSSSSSCRKFLFLILLLPGSVMVHRHSSISSLGSRLSQTLATPDPHPIERLAINGQAQFSSLLTSQSNTLRKAVAEYIRRYKRNPPPNFDKWFKIARREEYVLLDEFDNIMETIEPFWGIPPSELRQRVNAAFKDPRLIRFNISDANVSFDHEGWATWIPSQMLSWLPLDYRLLLPNMTFAVNILDEPRVVTSHEVISRALHSASIGVLSASDADIPHEQRLSRTEVDFSNIGRHDVWQALSMACDFKPPARDDNASGTSLRFIANVTDGLDICEHPSLHDMHGFLSSPDSLDITHTLVPIFSQGKPSIFNDILFPSPYYAGRMDKEDYLQEEDPHWTKKSDTLYWSGGTTGGYATIENWKSLHRQRLMLSLQSQESKLVTVLNETSPGQWDPRIIPISELRSLFDTKMTGIVQCEPEACEAERTAFNIIPYDGDKNPNTEPLNATYQSKYVLDIDGNGFSGRYYRLLKSRSAVVKQTIFKEWHDGHLVPWVHYIPLSMDADELPEIMRFLVHDPRGRKLGERIARESRSWANITFRKIDLQLAFLRLLLEYGRLMSDDRDTLGYKP